MDRHLSLTLFLVFAKFPQSVFPAPLKTLNLSETAICTSNASTAFPLCLSLRTNRALPLVSMLTAIPVLADSLSVMEAAQKTYSKINNYLGDDNNSNEDSKEDQDRKTPASKGSIPPKFKAPPPSKNGSTSAHHQDENSAEHEHHPHHNHRRPIIIVQNIVVNLPAPNASTGNFSHLIVNLSNGTNVPAVMISSLTNATMSKNNTHIFKDLADDF